MEGVPRLKEEGPFKFGKLVAGQVTNASIVTKMEDVVSPSAL